MIHNAFIFYCQAIANQAHDLFMDLFISLIHKKAMDKLVKNRIKQ